MTPGATPPVAHEQSVNPAAAVCHWMTLLGSPGTYLMYSSKKNDPTIRPEAAKAANWSIIPTLAMIGFYLATKFIAASAPSRYINPAAYANYQLIITVMNFGILAAYLLMIVVGIMNALRVSQGKPSKIPFHGGRLT